MQRAYGKQKRYSKKYDRLWLAQRSHGWNPNMTRKSENERLISLKISMLGCQTEQYSLTYLLVIINGTVVWIMRSNSISLPPQGQHDHIGDPAIVKCACHCSVTIPAAVHLQSTFQQCWCCCAMMWCMEFQTVVPPLHLSAMKPWSAHAPSNSSKNQVDNRENRGRAKNWQWGKYYDVTSSPYFNHVTASLAFLFPQYQYCYDIQEYDLAYLRKRHTSLLSISIIWSI